MAPITGATPSSISTVPARSPFSRALGPMACAVSAGAPTTSMSSAGTVKPSARSGSSRLRRRAMGVRHTRSQNRLERRERCRPNPAGRRGRVPFRACESIRSMPPMHPINMETRAPAATWKARYGLPPTIQSWNHEEPAISR